MEKFNEILSNNRKMNGWTIGKWIHDMPQKFSNFKDEEFFICLQRKYPKLIEKTPNELINIIISKEQFCTNSLGIIYDYFSPQ
jgi:hypothetical protein